MAHQMRIPDVGALRASEILSFIGHGDIVFADGAPEPVGDRWPQELTKIYRERVSTRVVQTCREDGAFEISIFSFSSPEDIELAVRLGAAVARLSGRPIFFDGAGPFDHEGFLAEHGTDFAERMSAGMLERSLRQYTEGMKRRDTDEVVIGFNSTKRAIRLGPRSLEPLLGSSENLTAELLRRVRLLNYVDDNPGIYVPSGLSLTGKDAAGTVVFEHRSTFLSPHSATLLSTGYSEVTLGRSDGDTVTMALPKLIGLLGERGVWLDEENFLSKPLSPSEYEELMELGEKVVKPSGPLPAHAKEAEKEFRSQSFERLFDSLAPEDRETLFAAPLAVFVLVACSDGTIDEKEMNTFWNLIVSASESDVDLMSAIAFMLTHRVDCEALLKKLLVAGAAESVLGSTGRLVSHLLPEPDARSFVADLNALGERIAEASGGLLGIFGNKVSREERRALKKISILLSAGLNAPSSSRVESNEFTEPPRQQCHGEDHDPLSALSPSDAHVLTLAPAAVVGLLVAANPKLAGEVDVRFKMSLLMAAGEPSQDLMKSVSLSLFKLMTTVNLPTELAKYAPQVVLGQARQLAEKVSGPAAAERFAEKLYAQAVYTVTGKTGLAAGETGSIGGAEHRALKLLRKLLLLDADLVH